MEVAKFLALPTILAFFVLSLHFITKLVKLRKDPNLNLPPGNLGWHILGETFEYMRAARQGTLVRFIKERMEKHDSRVFKTSFLGDHTAVFCGPAGNKFLFSNENKNLQLWWPSSIRKLLGTSLISKVGEEAKMTRKLLLSFLSAEALRNYLPKMDIIAQNHIQTHWKGKEEVVVYSTVQLYTYALACCLFLSIEDPIHVSEFSPKLDDFLKGMLGFPINLPGTRFHRSMKAADEITKEVKMIIRKRKLDLQEKKVSPTQDLLSHLIVTPDSNGRFMTETEISDNMLLLLFAGHDTARSALSSIMKYLGSIPQVYEQVLNEQLEISREKEAGELLQWEDIQKMKYSWNVASEVMRLLPPVAGTYREAIKDFHYAGYTIPKGWKLRWLPSSTHVDPAYFPNPEAFDASRLEILVFMHHIVKCFKWDLLNSDENFGYDSLLQPAEGLPIRLHPHAIVDSDQRL
ncbi:hypothetical protein PIB30_056225 [Stylosanthes scabra]|uniref:Uncharacterized protein n=1 Tax=Stylosanthes scabra TaxID=79078 RepID=A0ABU6RJ80_9FABA|nr:hypothetical protein [Stylosanthes scabra]